jgi:hypothetical protein
MAASRKPQYRVLDMEQDRQGRLMAHQHRLLLERLASLP